MNLGIRPIINTHQAQVKNNKQNVSFGAKSYPIAKYVGSLLEHQRTTDCLVRHFVAPMPEHIASEIKQLSQGKAIILDPAEEKAFNGMKYLKKTPKEIGEFLLECIKNATSATTSKHIEPNALENILKVDLPSNGIGYGLGVEAGPFM